MSTQTLKQMLTAALLKEPKGGGNLNGYLTVRLSKKQSLHAVESRSAGKRTKHHHTVTIRKLRDVQTQKNKQRGLLT